MEELRISEQFLDQILLQRAKNLVGESMKRFETITDKETLKKEIKELIYENFRDIKGLLVSFNSGVKFIAPPKKE